MDVQGKREKFTAVGDDKVGTASPAKKPGKAKKVLLGLIAAFLVIGIGVYVHNLGRETTDDAQVEGRIANVAARAGGQVVKVLVQDNQLVQAGEPLVEIDQTELEARLAAATADLAAAQAGLKTAAAQLSMTETSSATNITAARSRYDLALVELQRVEKLRKDGVVSTSEYDAKKAAFDQAKAGLEQAEAKIHGSKGSAQVEAAIAAVDLGKARVQQAEASKKLAEVNLGYAVVKAPIAGLVSRRTVEQGQVVAPGTPLLALVPLDDVWVVANFKEDQIADMQPGQIVDVEVDTYGGRKFQGHVESVAAATGSKFALLPPDNASGNFVKVVQRVPVLIRLDRKDAKEPLRPGMSAVVTVHTDVKSKT